jgi:hypothetical protein
MTGRIEPHDVRLALQELELVLDAPPVVLAGAFEVGVHFLNVGHEVCQPRPLHRKSLVLVGKSALDVL